MTEKQYHIDLAPGDVGYQSHALRLSLPLDNPRLACRYSGGKFIVWLRDHPLVVVLEVR